MITSNSVKYLHLSLSLIGICFSINYSETQSVADLELTIPQGSLQGRIWTTHHKRDVLAFERIPYAQPPIGNLRFANPVAAGNWSGILNATSTGNPCIQLASGVLTGEEDCLHLHVYTPQFPKNTDSSLLPVMVFVHGGTFKQGGPLVDSQNPHFLLDKDVLLVVVNYRLGPMGFLSTGDEVASGNWGLKDVILSLKWVQNNIKYFGGDSDQVTLFGGSSGGVMVHLLALSDAADGLYHKYITQSGSALGAGSYQPRAVYASRAFELGEYVGCVNDSSDSLINCLRTVNASEIIATGSQFVVWHIDPLIVWAPTDEPDIEGAVLTDSPANLFAAGKIRDLPCITGVTRDEGLSTTAVFYVNETLLHEFLENFDYLLPIMLIWTTQPDSVATWVEAVKSYYLDNDLTQNASVLLPRLTHLFGDAPFIYPAYSALQKQLALSKNPQYFYLFNYEGAISGTFVYAGTREILGVPHGDEMNYLFLRSEYYAAHGGNMSETDLEMADIMVELWTSFATNGTPTSSALDPSTPWRPYSSEDNYLRIGNYCDITPGIEYSFFLERMQFWADLEATEPIASPLSASSALNTISILLFALLLLCLKVS